MKESQKEQFSENVEGAYLKITTLLSQIVSIANNNISKAENFDLEDFAQQLDSHLNQLMEIGEFETYDD